MISTAQRRVRRHGLLATLSATAYPLLVLSMTLAVGIVVVQQGRLDPTHLARQGLRDGAILLAATAIPALHGIRRMRGLQARFHWLGFMERMEVELNDGAQPVTVLLRAGAALPVRSRRLLRQALAEGADLRLLPARLGCPGDLARAFATARSLAELAAFLPEAIPGAERDLTETIGRGAAVLHRGLLLLAGLTLLWAALRIIRPAMLAPLLETFR